MHSSDEKIRIINPGGIKSDTRDPGTYILSHIRHQTASPAEILIKVTRIISYRWYQLGSSPNAFLNASSISRSASRAASLFCLLGRRDRRVTDGPGSLDWGVTELVSRVRFEWRVGVDVVRSGEWSP